VVIFKGRIEQICSGWKVVVVEKDQS
jgi:hypothetical protein